MAHDLKQCSDRKAFEIAGDILQQSRKKEDAGPGQCAPNSGLIPFEDHAKIITSFLQNSNGTKGDDSGLEYTFVLYVTQMSFSLHHHQLRSDQNIIKFFRDDPPSLKSRPLLITCKGLYGRRGEDLTRYLGEIEQMLAEEEVVEIKAIANLVGRLLTDIIAIRQDRRNQTMYGDSFMSNTVPGLVETVHRMLGIHLHEYQKAHLRVQNDDKMGALEDAVERYMRLHDVVGQMDVLIQTYIKFINEDGRDWGADAWGTCISKWLYGVTAQGYAARWLWQNRKKLKFATEVI